MNTLGWILLVLAIIIIGIIVSVIVKFKDKLKPALLKLIELIKKINWEQLYEKAQKSGILDKIVKFVNSRKKT